MFIYPRKKKITCCQIEKLLMCDDWRQRAHHNMMIVMSNEAETPTK